MTKNRIDALTGIRGIAALWVLLHHLVSQYPLQGKLPVLVEHIAEKGWLGVDLFFILSGFVIAYVHHKDFATQVTGNTMKQFMVKRIARIYPVHLLTTLSLVPIYFGAKWAFGYDSPVNAFSLEKLLYSVSLTNGFGFHDSLGWNAPSWSVSSEFLAYLAFPFLAALLLRKQLSALLCFALIAVIFIITTSIGWVLTDKNSYIAGWEWVSVRVLSEFIFGMLIFQLYRLNFKAPFWLFAILSALVIVYMSVINAHSRWDWVMVLTFGVLIYSLTNSEHGVSRFLASANMKYLGEISYSIYLCHGVVFMVFNSALPKLLPSGEGLFLLIPILIYVVLTLIVAHFMYKLVEIPAQAYLKKRLL